MAEFIKIDFENEDDIIFALDRAEHRAKSGAKDLIDNLSAFGYHVLQTSVPRFTTYLLRHIARTDAQWRPGGAGGGGSWEAIVGIKRGTSKHPLYVEFGTGLYGAVGWFITPVSFAVMRFYSTKFNRYISVSHTRGQKPQRYMYTTWREMLVYARGRMMLVDMLGRN